MFEDVKNCGAGKFVSRDEWIHPERIIDSNVILFVTKGEVFINEDGKEYHVTPDEVIFLQANMRHFGYKSSINTEFFWLHWYGGPAFFADMKLRKIQNPYSVSLYFRQLLDSCITKKMTEGIDYLTRLILIEIYTNSNPPTTHHTAERVASFIEANRHTSITESQVCAHFGYNTDYLNRLFKSNFSQTIKQYINKKRLEHIKGLMLRGELPLKEIAIQSGFSDYKNFLKFFKYHEKQTPTEFYRLYAKFHINTR